MVMAKSKQVKKEERDVTPKKNNTILGVYKPVPHFNGGCSTC